MNVSYEKGSLKINLETNDAAAAHNGLMRAVVTSLRCQMDNDCPIDRNIKEGNSSLLKLLETLIPTENHLEKCYL